MLQISLSPAHSPLQLRPAMLAASGTSRFALALTAAGPPAAGAEPGAPLAEARQALAEGGKDLPESMPDALIPDSESDPDTGEDAEDASQDLPFAWFAAGAPPLAVHAGGPKALAGAHTPVAGTLDARAPWLPDADARAGQPPEPAPRGAGPRESIAATRPASPTTPTAPVPAVAVAAPSDQAPNGAPASASAALPPTAAASAVPEGPAAAAPANAARPTPAGMAPTDSALPATVALPAGVALRARADAPVAAPHADAAGRPSAQPAVADGPTPAGQYATGPSQAVQPHVAAPKTVAAHPAAPQVAAAAAPLFVPVEGPAAPRRASPREADAINLLAPLANDGARVPLVAPTAQPQQGALDMRRDQWMGDMLDRIEMLRDSAGPRETRIRLTPDALGSVEVSIRHEGDRVHVHFAAENQAARTLLTEAQPRLAELAEARGLKLGQASVDSGAAGNGNPRQEAAPRASQQPTANRYRADARGSDTNDQRIA